MVVNIFSFAKNNTIIITTLMSENFPEWVFDTRIKRSRKIENKVFYFDFNHDK